MFHRKKRRGQHHKCPDDLRQAADGGCKICIVLTLSRNSPDPVSDIAKDTTTCPILEYEWIPGASKRTTGYYSILFDSEGDWLAEQQHHSRIDIHVSDIIESAPDWYIEVLKYAVEDIKSQPWRVRRECFPLRDFPSHTGHESVLAVAKIWMDTCEREHKSEHLDATAKDSEWHPKRLIDLTNPKKPRLLETASESPSGHYATLSHCWGPNPQFLTLLERNLDSFREEIPLADLPRSFQDAIFVCCHLGIRYLWIDSLCIMQNSVVDWNLHAKQMALVYSNCVLNFSFDKGSCPEDGGFTERGTDLLQECCLFSSWPDGMSLDEISDDEKTEEDYEGKSLGRLLSGKMRRLTVFSWPDYNRSTTISLAKVPLSDRGWVVQERLLSPRVLHFGWDRISWECGEIGSLNEALPIGFGNTGKQFDPEPRGPFNFEAVETGSSVLASAFNWWSQILTEYTKRKLTYPDKDKLVALAAVAQKFGGRYYAGHHRGTMPFCLLWVYITRTGHNLCGPTWSWASVDDVVWNISVPRSSNFAAAEVEHVEVELVDPDNEYGQVKSGKIKMRCFLMHCKLIGKEPVTEPRMHPAHQERWNIEILGKGLHNESSNGPPTNAFQATSYLYLDRPEEALPDVTYFATLVKWRAADESELKRRLQGIVLKIRGDGVYTRLGYWDTGSDKYRNVLEGSVKMSQYFDRYSPDHEVVVTVV